MTCKNLVFFGGQGTAQQAQKSSLELFPVIWQEFDALWTPPITPKARRGCILPNRGPLPLQEVSEHTCFGGAGSGAATQQLTIGQPRVDLRVCVNSPTGMAQLHNNKSVISQLTNTHLRALACLSGWFNCTRMGQSLGKLTERFIGERWPIYHREYRPFNTNLTSVSKAL